MNIIQEIEREQMDAVLAKRGVPEFSPGDTIKVMVKVIEVNEANLKDKKKTAKPQITERLQAYEGVVIARSGGGLNETFTVRKISYGEGVERVFPVYSPYIAEIEVIRRGKVRRAKLYYLRGRRGKSARIYERTDARARRLNLPWKGFRRPKGEADDLTQIEGITAGIARRLKRLNCIRFEQIANFSDEDIANVDAALNLKGAIEGQDWVGQARMQLMEMEAIALGAEDEEAYSGSYVARRQYNSTNKISEYRSIDQKGKSIHDSIRDARVEANSGSLPSKANAKEDGMGSWRTKEDIERGLHADDQQFTSLMRTIAYAHRHSDQSPVPIPFNAIKLLGNDILYRSATLLTKPSPEDVISGCRAIYEIGGLSLTNAEREDNRHFVTRLLRELDTQGFMSSVFRYDPESRNLKFRLEVLDRFYFGKERKDFVQGELPHLSNKIYLLIMSYGTDFADIKQPRYVVLDKDGRAETQVEIPQSVSGPLEISAYQDHQVFSRWLLNPNRMRGILEKSELASMADGRS